MEIEFALRPVSIMSGLSSHAVAELEDLHERATGLVRSDRLSTFELGRIFARIQSVLIEDTGTDSTVSAYCDLIGIARGSFYQMIKLFEVFEPYREQLPKISKAVQWYFARHKYEQDLLQQVIRLAEQEEVTNVVFQEQVLPRWQAKIERQIEEGALDYEEAEEEGEPAPPLSDRFASSSPVIAAKKLADSFSDPADKTVKSQSRKALEEGRAALVDQAFADTGDLIRKLDAFCRVNHISKAGWYEEVEAGANSLLSGIRAWKQVEVL